MADPESLLAALRSSPENAALLRLLVDACVRDGAATTLAEALALPGLADATATLSPRQLADASACLAAAGHADSAATLTPADPLAPVRALLEAGDRAGAGRAYRDALAANPTLDDPALAAELSGKIVSFASARHGAVTSIANDDTGAADAERLLQPPVERVDFGAVGGLEEVKQQIRRKIITPFLKPSLFDRFRRRSGGGILMYGPPGCGKTLLARATAGECGARFHNIAITDVLDMYIGESERKLHELFELARRTAPAVMFFDEIEALGGKRSGSREATSAKLVSQFLSELDGFAQNNGGVLILGATNVPWAVDSAFRRPGRFDRVLFVPPPDEAARREILSLELRDRPGGEAIDVAALARRTSGFSGADLRHLVETAVDEAIEQSISDGREHPIGEAHLRAALASTRPTTLEWLTSARNHARYANEGGQYDDVLEFLRRHGER